jgi:hypothetical protein
MEARRRKGRSIADLEIAAYALEIGPEAYRKEYHRLYVQTKAKSSYTGRTAPKSKAELEAIKNKYRNGVTMDQIKEMVGL